MRKIALIQIMLFFCLFHFIINPVLANSVLSDREQTLRRIVDKINPLSADYAPLLVNTSNGIPVHEYVISDLNTLMKFAEEQNVSFVVGSGYRSYKTQAVIYQNTPNKSVVMPPGTSQHQSGLAVDFTSAEINFQIDILAGFENTEAEKFLTEHVWKYGFVQPYIKGHDGISNEPWHYLYVGKEIALKYHETRQGGSDIDIFEFLK